MTASTIDSVELNKLKKQGVYMWLRKSINYDELKSIMKEIERKR